MQGRILGPIALVVVLILPGMGFSSTGAEKAVGVVLDSLHQAASEADGALYFSLFSENAVFMGTDATERWSVEQFQAFAEPYFSAGRGWTYEVRDRHVSLAAGGTTAWFDEVLWNKSYGTCRGTGVLVLSDGSWRISQYNLTIPIPNELTRDVARRIKRLEEGEDAAAVQADLTVFLVRHAEKVVASRDPELSPAGLKRARQLADNLRDARIEQIHSSDFRRTRDTATPLAADLGLDVELYDPGDLVALVDRLRSEGGRHLVVGHSDTTPTVVELLGGDPGSEINERREFDRLYMVIIDSDGAVQTSLLRYGLPYGGGNAE